MTIQVVCKRSVYQLPGSWFKVFLEHCSFDSIKLKWLDFLIHSPKEWISSKINWTLYLNWSFMKYIYSRELRTKFYAIKIQSAGVLLFLTTESKRERLSNILTTSSCQIFHDICIHPFEILIFHSKIQFLKTKTRLQRNALVIRWELFLVSFSVLLNGESFLICLFCILSNAIRFLFGIVLSSIWSYYSYLMASFVYGNSVINDSPIADTFFRFA